MQNTAYRYVAKTFEKAVRHEIFLKCSNNFTDEEQCLNTAQPGSAAWERGLGARPGSAKDCGGSARGGCIDASLKNLGILKNRGREIRSVLDIGEQLVLY